MDKIDKKIIAELLKNSRSHYSRIGKAVGISRENVYYRIQSLVRKGIVKGFVSNIDYRRMGFERYVVFLQAGLDTESEELLINYLKSEEFVSWIGLLSGKWYLTFDIYAKSSRELDKIVDKILSRFNCIDEYLILQARKSCYFFNKIISAPNIKRHSQAKEHKIDKVDISVLNMLNENSRESYVNISNNMKKTANAIKGRVRNLEKTGMISGYSISLDYEKLGFEWHGMQIKLARPSRDAETRIISYISSNPNVIFFYQYMKTGMYDFDVGIITKTPAELRKIISEIRSLFHGEINIIDTFLVLEEVSSHKLPPIIFKH